MKYYLDTLASYTGMKVVQGLSYASCLVQPALILKHNGQVHSFLKGKVRGKRLGNTDARVGPAPHDICDGITNSLEGSPNQWASGSGSVLEPNLGSGSVLETNLGSGSVLGTNLGSGSGLGPELGSGSELGPLWKKGEGSNKRNGNISGASYSKPADSVTLHADT